MNKKLIILSVLLCTIGLRIESSSVTVMGNNGWNGTIPECVLREHGMLGAEDSVSLTVKKPSMMKSMTSHEFTNLRKALSGNSIPGISHDFRLIASCLPVVKPIVEKDTLEKAKIACTTVGSSARTATEQVVSSAASTTTQFSTSSVSTAAKVGGPVAMLVGGMVVLDKYVSYKEKQAETERLANRSYLVRASDYVSSLAQSAKANTWDNNYGFKHSGKVVTVAGIAAIAGLSYLAYKKNPFGKAQNFKNRVQNRDNFKEQ